MFPILHFFGEGAGVLDLVNKKKLPFFESLFFHSTKETHNTDSF